MQFRHLRSSRVRVKHGDREQIRAMPLVHPQFVRNSGPRRPRTEHDPHLNLIEYDHGTSISCALNQLAHPFDVCRVDTTFSLNWLHDYRTRIFIYELLQALGPVQFTNTYTRHKGHEWVLELAS